MRKILFPIFLFFTLVNIQAQTIAEIHGTGDASPYDGQSVTTSGVVTAIASNSFFIQDGNDIRSGIYIYDQTYLSQIQVGDEVTVEGVVDEYFEMTEIVDLTALTVNSSGNTLPDPIILTTGEVSNEDYEGMLIKVAAATCTNTNLGFGEWEINDGSGACRVDDLMYPFSPVLNIDYAVTGPLVYTFSNYKIVPSESEDVTIELPLYFTVQPRETNILNNSLTIIWETNVPANTKISYGLTDALELGTLEDATLSTSHEMVLENLTPGTIYYVQPTSEAGTDATPLQTLVVATASNSSGKINVYFNHSVDHSVATDELAVTTNHIIDTIISYIDLAQQTLDVTMYEAENQEIVDAINAADNRGVQVRVISDAEGTNDVFDGLDAGIGYLEGNVGNPIMHNKFFVIDRDDVDNAWVLSGSMNHTVNNLGWDYNNVITIQDQSLARAYTLEFDEMWGGTSAQPDLNNAKFGSAKTDNTPHRFSINNIPVELYFSPTDGTAQKIQAIIDGAENEMVFAVLVFTENSLGNAVIDAKDRGVQVQGIIDYVEVNGSEFNFLLGNEVDVLDYQNADGSQWPDGPTLHHKYAIIDYEQGSTNPVLITGSHNWSASANSVHDENTLIIYDHTLANIYYQEFRQRFFELEFQVATEDLNIDLLQVAPNPFLDNLSFEIPEDGQLSVFDLNGKLILQQNIYKGTQNINTVGWGNGVYLVRFVGDEKQLIGKVIKK
ncbi:MAG: phospholipase D-like domain-containing protein [Bacteroidota bacterium]